jgi:cystathionine beta-lyase/cystathionine gamma-synthase
MVTSRDPDPASSDDTWHPETLAVRAGRTSGISAMAPVLWASTTYEMDSLESGRRLAHSTRAAEFYSRHGNPTVNAFEEAVAALEGMEAARAYASGMGAIAGVVLGLCGKGDHIVAQRQLYGGTMQLLAGVCPRFGIDVTFVDGTEPGAFARAVQPGRTMMVLAENPANPLLDVVDLADLGAIRGPITVVDSTLSTPLGVRPGEYGVQLVVHSATKAMAGHNDATLGVVAGSRDLIDSLWGFAVLQGACASPFDALNGLRGLRTLAPRFAQQSATALAVARFLETQDCVASVHYPGLDSHPQHALAVRQQALHGGVLAFDLRDGLDAGASFVDSVRLCRPATSMGGPETLVTHPASTTHAGMTPEELAASGITAGTVRMSCGLEHVDDVIADLARALKM